MQLLRQHHDAEWKLLSVHELREHERVLVESGKYGCKSNQGRPKWGRHITETGSEAEKNPGQSLAMLKAPLFHDGVRTWVRSAGGKQKVSSVRFANRR